MQNVVQLQKSYQEYYQSFVRPRPAKERVDFLSRFGLESVFIIIYVLSSALLSALRTGSVFAEIEERLLAGTKMEQLSGLLSAFAGLLALAAIEGSLFAFGYSEARRGNVKDVPKVVIVLSLSTVIAAGFYASSKAFGAISEWKTALEMFVALATAVAPPLLAFFGGASVGKIHLEYSLAVLNAEREYQEKLKQWEEAMNRSFISWASRNGIRVAGLIQAGDGDFANEQEQFAANERANWRTRTNDGQSNERERFARTRTGLPNEQTEVRTNANARTRQRTNANELERTNGQTSEPANERANEPASERTFAQTNEQTRTFARTNGAGAGQGERTNGARSRDLIEDVYRSLKEAGIAPTVGAVSAEYARMIGKNPDDVKGYVSQVIRGINLRAPGVQGEKG